MGSLQANRPELALLRGKRSEDNLRLWTSAFAGGDYEKAQRYLAALGVFLGAPPGETQEGWERYIGTLSPNTRKAYSFALNEFFEWAAAEHGQVVPPERVTQVDAERYVQWLARRDFGLEEEKLKDGDMKDRLAIYRAIQRLGTANIRDIAAALPSSVKGRYTIQVPEGPNRHREEFDIQWLNHELGRMVLHDVLTRSPTLAQLREDNPRVGIDQYVVHIRQGEDTRVVALMDAFNYRVPKPRAVSRTTIQARLSALVSFWNVLLSAGPDGSAMVPGNVFYTVRKRVSRGVSSERKRAAATQRIEPWLVARLRDAADEAHTLAEWRDRALLYMLIFTGARASEVLLVRRGVPTSSSERNTWPGWVDPNCEPPMLTLTRKGEKRESLPYPPLAFRALVEFQAKLASAAAPADAQTTDPDAPSYIHPESARLLYRELARMPDAPLFPPLNFWGANTSWRYEALKPNPHADRGPFHYTRPMSRHGIAAALKRLAKRAKFAPAEARQVHPHALRHFALDAMIKGGKALREVQAIAGHASVTTTEQYLEDIYDVVALSGQTEVLDYLSRFAPTAVCEVPEAERPTPPGAPPLVETVGVEYPPEKAPPEPVSSALKSVEKPVPREITAAVEAPERPPEPALPDNDLPVVPTPDPAPAKAVETAQGQALEVGDRVVSVDGEEPPEDADRPADYQMIDGKSAGAPIETSYEAMDDAQRAIRDLDRATQTGDQEAIAQAKKDLRAAKREEIEFTKVKARENKSQKLIEVEKKKPKNKPEYYIEKVQANPWLAANYDPWPTNFGISKESLLPWFAKGSANRYGYVHVKAVGHEVPPFPVFSPEQVNPETVGGRQVFDFIERVYAEWIDGDPSAGIPPSPTRTQGLLRWFAFFTYVASKLDDFTSKGNLRITWKGWNELCQLGSDIRSHKAEWLEKWMRANAHTYMTALREFRRVPRGKGLVQDILFHSAFERATFEGVAMAANIPTWFAQDDPIKSLPPSEYNRFAKWMANVTGQRLTRDRRSSRSQQKSSAKRAQKISEQDLRGMLDFYYDEMDARERLLKQDKLSEAKTHTWTMRQLEDSFQQAGMPHPNAPEFAKIKPRRPARVNALVKAWKDAHPTTDETSANVFQGSKLFEPDAFRIDRTHHTISHTTEFKEAFYETYRQDSELIMRRAARAMWEARKEMAAPLEEQLTSRDYNYLHSVMLCYMAWIVPSGAEMEERMKERGIVALPPGSTRRQWLDSQIGCIREELFSASSEELNAERVAAEIDQRKREGMDERSAAEATQLAMVIEDHFAEAAAMGEEEVIEGMGVEAPEKAQQEREAWQRQRKEAEPQPAPVIHRKPTELGIEGKQFSPAKVVRRKKLTPNGQVALDMLEGERPRRFYRVNTGDAQQHLYVSVGVLEQTHELLRNPRRALPSPFQMMRAMSLD